MNFISIERAVKISVIVVGGTLLAGILCGQTSFLPIGMRMIGIGAIVYALVCRLKDKKNNTQFIEKQIEYHTMVLISSIAFLLANMMTYKNVLRIDTLFWMVIIIITIVKIWRDAC